MSRTPISSDWILRGLVVLALLTPAAGCGDDLVLWDGGRLVTGEWNGMHVSLSLDARGGEVEFDCAHGGLYEALQPDASGRFSVPGVFVREHGGPIRVDEVPDSIPAQYMGRIMLGELTLRALVAGDTIGPFSLRRDGAGRLLKCL